MNSTETAREMDACRLGIILKASAASLAAASGAAALSFERDEPVTERALREAREALAEATEALAQYGRENAARKKHSI